jgi:hypothetical protein
MIKEERNRERERKKRKKMGRKADAQCNNFVCGRNEISGEEFSHRK